jgi:hypothetical protein
MQTFLISPNPKETAKILDNKRLGKQRVEAIQIANILLGIQNSNAWKNHPAVLMWKGYEKFLVHDYLKAMILEWGNRGYHGEKCKEHYIRLMKILFPNTIEKEITDKIKIPGWFCDELFNSHKSNLMRKDSNYYFWYGIPNNLEYWWPTRYEYKIRSI